VRLKFLIAINRTRTRNRSLWQLNVLVNKSVQKTVNSHNGALHVSLTITDNKL